MKSLRLLPLTVFAALACGDDKTTRVQSPLSATPSVIDFGKVPVGEGNQKTVLLRNNGSVDLRVRTLTLEEKGQDAGKEFELIRMLERARCADGVYIGPPKAPDTIAAGECATITVVYAPLERAQDDALLTIQGDEEGQEPFLIPVTGRGVGADVVVCAVTPDTGEEVCHETGQALMVDFGIVPLEGAVRRVLRIKNVGDAPLQVTEASIRRGDPAFSADPAVVAGEIAPGQQAALEVVFAPQIGGVRKAVYQVESNDNAERAVIVDLLARGDAPQICFTQAPELDYGAVEAGSDLVKDVEVWNCGTQQFELRALTFSLSTPFSFVTAPILPVTLKTVDAGTDDRLTVQVKFAPPAPGAFEVMLNARTDYAVNAGGLKLLGQGKPSPACQIGVAPVALNFGSAVVNGTPNQRDVVLQNLGENPCTVSAPTVTAGAAVEFRVAGGQSFPFTLDSGRARNVRLEYAPKSLGNHTGKVSIPTSDPQKPTVVVDLSGTATGAPVCKIEVQPAGTTFGATLNFGDVEIGRDRTVPVILRNVGSASCAIGGAIIAAQAMLPLGNPNDFKIVSTVPTSLAPGASAQIDVRFRPSGEVDYTFGGFMALPLVGLQVNTSDTSADQNHQCTIPSGYFSQAGCRQVSFTGRGVRSPLSVVPGELDWGVITLGCPVSRKVVTIYNLGSSNITLNAISVTPVGGPFTKVSGPPTPYTLAAGASVKVTVGYAPVATGLETGILTIDYTLSGSQGQKTVPLTGAGTTDAAQVDLFTQAAKPLVDVLFVVDDSGSMSEEQSALSQNGERFMQIAISLSTDFHVGVITTDVESAHTCGSGILGGNCGWPNLTIEPGVLWGNPKFITNTTPDPVGVFKKNIKPGTNGSGTEKGLRAAEMALTEPLVSDPQKNGGFLREEAKLSVVFVSDEDDSSAGAVDYYVDFLRSIKGYRNTSLLSVAAIVGDDASLGAGTDNGCRSPNGDAAPGSRYIQVVNRLGGIFRSICSTDWGRIAEDLGLDAFGARAEFFLSRQADPATIQVKVNNASSPAGNWSYDGTANSIVFAPAHVPGPGATIEVRYNATCPP